MLTKKDVHHVRQIHKRKSVKSIEVSNFALIVKRTTILKLNSLI
jgi:hypothetical protein